MGSAAVVLIATLSSSFLSAITLATSTRVVVYVAGCLALIALRRRADVPAAMFVAPFGRVIAVVATALSVALLMNASTRELLQLTIAAAAGIIIYVIVRSRAQRQPS